MTDAQKQQQQQAEQQRRLTALASATEQAAKSQPAWQRKSTSDCAAHLRQMAKQPATW